jgi:hypothetical protein
MILTEYGKTFLDDPSVFVEYGLNILVNICGTEIIKDNKILPICTYYLESEDGNVVFLADYCTPKEAKKLEDKIKTSIEIKKEKKFEIKENEDKSRDQEMLRYIAYSNPDIRSVVFSGKAEIQGNSILISNNKILLNSEETSPKDFLIKLFSQDNDTEKKIELISEIEKKRLLLEEIMQQLIYIANTIQNNTVIPKIIENDGENQPAILFKDNNGKYNAIAIGKRKPEVVNKIKIISDCSWDKIKEAIENNEFINNKTDNLIEQLLEGN